MYGYDHDELIQKTTVLSVELYGCETWSYIKGGPQTKGSEKSMQRRVSGPKSDANGEWRMFHNEEVHNLHR